MAKKKISPGLCVFLDCGYFSCFVFVVLMVVGAETGTGTGTGLSDLNELRNENSNGNGGENGESSSVLQRLTALETKNRKQEEINGKLKEQLKSLSDKFDEFKEKISSDHGVWFLAPPLRGPPGKKGDKGENGKDGRTPEKGGSGQVFPVKTTTKPPTTRKPPIKTLTCPNPSTISPCRCTNSAGIYILCLGSTVTPTSIANSFRELRRVNGIPEDRGVDIYHFYLHSTELTQFDLAPLYGSKMDILEFYGNSKLTKLVTSGNPQDHGSIHAAKFQLWLNSINGEEFGDILKYFSVEMTTFRASNVQLNNRAEADEFIPGLSAFTNLTTLMLQRCNISGRLSSSHFKPFPRLQHIDLRNNEINGIGENVFPSNVATFDLEYNKLNENSFHPNSGITRTGRKTTLDLDSNQFTTLPAQIFQGFLDAYPQNILSLNGNPLICDERLIWIKSRREEFKSRVVNTVCSNDKRHTVFNSNLIP